MFLLFFTVFRSIIFIGPDIGKINCVHAEESEHYFSDIDEEIKTIGSFGIDEVVGGIVRCVRAISSDCDLPTSLPQNMAQRFRAAAAIAQAVKVGVLLCVYGYVEGKLQIHGYNIAYCLYSYL